MRANFFKNSENPVKTVV